MHESKAVGQPIQDGAKTLELHNIQRNAIQKSMPSPFEWKNVSAQSHYSAEKLFTLGFGQLLIHVEVAVNSKE